MKALVFDKADHMEVMEKAKPELREGEALIKVNYIGICGSDVHLYHGLHPTATFPIVPGHEFVGELVDIKGEGADAFTLGESVVAQEVISCGRCDACAQGEDNVCRDLKLIGIHTDGGFAEYVKVRTRKMYRVAKGVDLQLAALTEPLAVAVHDVRRSGLKAGQTALIIGGGPIGMLVAIMAKLTGASKIVVSEPMKYRRDYAEKLGFSVIDPMDIHFNQKLKNLSDARGFDVAFEAAGFPKAMSVCLEHLKPCGTAVQIAMSSKAPDLSFTPIFSKELTIKGVRVHSQENFAAALDIITSGRINSEIKQLISKVFDFEHVKDAFDCAMNDKNVFKVLVKISD